MTTSERLRQKIDDRQQTLSAAIPADRAGAIIAIIRAQDSERPTRDAAPVPDPITGQRLPNLGGKLALRLCLEAPATGNQPGSSVGDLDRWAVDFLDECSQLAEAEIVLGHVETGFMRIADTLDGGFDAWIATRREPTSWRERADFDWWATWLAARHQPVSAPTDRADDGHYSRLAETHQAAMMYQLGYPPDAVIDGCSVRNYCDVLRWLIAHALAAQELGNALSPRSESELVATMAAQMPIGPKAAQLALSAFVLDSENAGYHAAVPGVAPAPLVRIGQNEVVWSVFGLTHEPLLFMTRELRRRATEQYNNSAVHREDVFRQDLYALFRDKRFVTSEGRIELRRSSGNVRTDIDAAVFDRKTGTLGLFELKSQDPFARSTAESIRQRDNLLYANRQVSGMLTWLNRQGAADDLLERVDRRTAKTFRAQRVLPFVIGRYLAHFSDGAEPDRRAAWATWPEILQLTDGKPFGAKDGNPLVSLHNRLTSAASNPRLIIEGDQRTIAIGDTLLRAFPSYSAVHEHQQAT